jgi:hypothetical protein
MSSLTDRAEADPRDDELTADQREMLEWIRDNSDRLSEVAARMLQEDSEEVSNS